MSVTWDAATLPGTRVVVAGGARSGAAVSRALARRGAHVGIVDSRPDVLTGELRDLGVGYLGELSAVPAGTDLVVTSPGWPPTQPMLADAVRRGLPVVGEIEVAWALRDPAIPWLAVTGTNGKTTTVGMLTAILAAAGRRPAEVGNVGPPVIDAVTEPDQDYDVYAVELSSFQLHWSPSVRPVAGAVLNIAADHLDWHGSLAAYAEDKTRIWGGGEAVCVYNADDPHVVELASRLPTDARRVPVTTGPPADGGLGVIDGMLVDRSDLVADDSELIAAREIRPAGQHNVCNALVAAALARSIGVPAAAVAAGLRDYQPGAHRNVRVATEEYQAGRIHYVNDTKATNAHATAASLMSYQPIVWIAGGLLKGAVAGDFAGLVEQAAARLRGAVLLGRDRAVIAEALRRHAPDVPIVDVPSADDRAMTDAVSAARELACRQIEQGAAEVTVLLAPAAASWDMFRDYAHRGDMFSAAARAYAAGQHPA